MPGSYQFRDVNNRIIYVGKAKDLKKRVSSYFSKKDQDAKTKALVANIVSVDFIVTNSEKEALLLESTLVKKHLPKYNIDLKDSKRFAFIEITKEPYPRVILSRDKSSGGELFGPFTSGLERNLIIETINRHFQLRTCKRLPKRPCIRFHIGLCPAPCMGGISEAAYDVSLAKARLILRGETKELVDNLRAEMKQSSDAQDFERALILRDQIEALNTLEESQSMERKKRFDEDVIVFMVRDDQVFLLVFNIFRGTLNNKQEFVLDYSEDFLEEFITRFYEDNSIPKEIILRVALSRPLLDVLSEKCGSKVSAICPKQGEKRTLLELAEKNLEISFFGKSAKLERLRERLKLNATPNVIECFDISHLSGTSTVGSMAQFRGGIPYKSGYRRFRITTVESIDDFRSIAEVVRRRYARLTFEKAQMPDLIVIDGGKGQLGAALAELKKFNLRIPIISLAKRNEEIFAPGRPHPIILEKKDPALQLLQEIRDEAHRFAITYNRLLRSKKLKD